ncbi:MAG: exodeoxyribonuclease small subunit [Thermotogaceae bacterium]|jgi:exodeoxyribonuclease VII small subunit|nr:exodeoxyribonuclease small subunit [Thermotogaceae bacterium]MDN5337865.1 exodeoxyribonuclease small subunit [Thermotogaceae bacterium]
MKKDKNSQNFEQELDFEKAFNRLDEIIRLLENDKISLDESIELFKEGVKLYKYCRSKLDSAKLVVKDVMKELEESLQKQQNDISGIQEGESADDSQ